MQLDAAVKSLSVMAEEMDKDRKRTVKLQGKLDKSKKGPTKSKEGKKGRKVSMPDPSEAIEKRAAKLEELLDGTLQEIQVLGQ